jgi:bacterioferritin
MDQSDNVMKCSAKIKYPEIKVEKPNYSYGIILLDDLASAVSETTAVMQYLNHSYTIADNKLASLLNCIAISEMHHFEILNELVKKFGVTPVYANFCGSCGTYWNASYVYYGYETKDKIESDIQGEQAAIDQYKKHIKMIDDKYVRDILKRIIKDEEHHIELLNGAYK